MEFQAAPSDLIADVWRASWGGVVVSRDHVYLPVDVEGLALYDDGRLLALATFSVEGSVAEVVSLDALERSHGNGPALLGEVERRLAARGVKRSWLLTTNDNIAAIGVYLRGGYRLVAVHLDAMDEVRRIKPAVPLIGENGIPLRDTWEFEKVL